MTKQFNILMPDAGPFGETRFDASDRTMVSASFVNSSSGGNLETVFTVATHRQPDRRFDFLPEVARSFLVTEDFLAKGASRILWKGQMRIGPEALIRTSTLDPTPAARYEENFSQSTDWICARMGGHFR